MTTNMSEVFNSVLKGARSLPFTALVQLTFFCLNSYFIARRELSANRSASDEQFTPYVDAQIQGRVVKSSSMEIVLYDHIQGQFHVKLRSGRTHCLNLHDKKCTCGKFMIYGFPCSHIIAACQHRCVDFRLFVQAYYTTESYNDTWASLFHPIFNEDEWPLYDGPTIVPPESMKRIGSGVTPKTRGSVNYPSTRGNTRECRVTRHFSRKSGRVSFVRGALPKYKTCIYLSQTVQ